VHRVENRGSLDRRDDVSDEGSDHAARSARHGAVLVLVGVLPREGRRRRQAAAQFVHRGTDRHARLARFDRRLLVAHLGGRAGREECAQPDLERLRGGADLRRRLHFGVRVLVMARTSCGSVVHGRPPPSRRIPR
jgi:hypothetical protein